MPLHPKSGDTQPRWCEVRLKELTSREVEAAQRYQGVPFSKVFAARLPLRRPCRACLDFLAVAARSRSSGWLLLTLSARVRSSAEWSLFSQQAQRTPRLGQALLLGGQQLGQLVEKRRERRVHGERRRRAMNALHPFPACAAAASSTSRMRRSNFCCIG